MKTKTYKIDRTRFSEMFADYTQDELGDCCNEPGGFLDVYGDTLEVPADWTEEKVYETMYSRFWDAYVAHLGCDDLESMEGFVEFYYNLENAAVSIMHEYANRTIYEVEFDDDRTVPAGRERKRLHVAGQGVFEEIVFEPLVKEKTYVLTLSEWFPKGHPKEGYATGFWQKFLCGLKYSVEPDYEPKISLPKIHTIRANYDLWKKRIDEVNAGRALLSVRQWEGKPYRSKQRELFRFDKDSGIGVEMLSKLFITCHANDYDYIKEMAVISDGDESFADIEMETLAENDGLTPEDWAAWIGFAPLRFAQPMAIIHFTNFRYCK